MLIIGWSLCLLNKPKYSFALLHYHRAPFKLLWNIAEPRYNNYLLDFQPKSSSVLSSASSHLVQLHI